MLDHLPFLDLTDPAFSTRSASVREARAQSWCARTPLGLAVLRYHEAGLLLRDRRLRQGSHAWPGAIGISGPFADFWQRSIISTEGPRLRALRQIVQTGLSEDFILSLLPEFESHASNLITALPHSGDIDFVAQFTEPFAGLATASLFGAEASQAPQIAQDAAALGLAMGHHAKQHEAKTNAACLRLIQRAGAMLHRPQQGGLVARMKQAAERIGVVDEHALIDLIVIAIFGGVDTTRAQLAFAVLLFAHHPEQWDWLRAHPDHTDLALAEVIRWRPTTTWASRQAVEDFTFGGIEIAQGTIVHILAHASSTDPEAGAPDRFDIRAKRKRHFGFGGGAHHCLGHFVARTDMAAALRVMLQHWHSIKVVGTPRFMPDSGNTSPLSLRIEPDWV